MKEWMPSFEERKRAWQNYDENLGEDDGHAQAIMLLTARKIAEWGDGPCPHGGTVVINYKARSYLRRECPDCWAEFKKEAGL